MGKKEVRKGGYSKRRKKKMNHKHTRERNYNLNALGLINQLNLLMNL